MRRAFDSAVKTYCIVERYKGKSYAEIGAGVAQIFDIKPPSMRRMQAWFAEYKDTTSECTDVKFVSQVIEDAANEAKPLAQAMMMGRMFSLWSRLQELHGPRDAGIVCALAILDDEFGRNALDRGYSLYKKWREDGKL